MARADAALMTSSNALFALLSHPRWLGKPAIKSGLAPICFEWAAHNSIDLAKITVVACSIVINGRRPP
jgi:hypothetical protein